MKRTIYRIVTAVIVLGIGAAIVYAFLPKPVEVDITTVTRGPMRTAVEKDGKTRIRNRYTVSAPLNGKVQRIELRRGMPIHAGETILAIIEPNLPDLKDDRERAQAKKRIDQAHANLQLAKEEYEIAKKEHERAKKSPISREELDRAAMREKAWEYAIKVRQFDLELAEAVLKVGPDSIGDNENKPFKIVAKVNGVVLDVPQESERAVQAGAELLKFGDCGDLEAIVDVLTTDAVKMRKGMEVVLNWGGKEPIIGRIESIDPAGFTKKSPLGVDEQRVYVVVNIVDHVPREKWEPLGDEYRVDAQIILWEEPDVLQIPEGALFRLPNKDWAVFVVEKGKAVRRTIKIGQRNGREVEVLGGLREDEQIILHPSDRVKDGVSVIQRSY